MPLYIPQIERDFYESLAICRTGEHPDGRRKGVRQMIEHANSHVAGRPKVKSCLCHLAEVMNPLLWQMIEG